MMTGAAEGHNESRLVDEIFQSVKIPSLPEAAANLVMLCRDEHVSASELVRVIELDPALAAKLLKVANSSYFGQQQRVCTLTRAAVVLGNDYLKAVALGFYVGTGWQHFDCPGFNIRQFWRDCILRACLAGQLATASEYRHRELAFLVGLIEDIGSLILATHFGAPYIETLNSHGRDFVQRRPIERSIFGTDHAYVTGALAKFWGFPDLLVTSLNRQCDLPPLAATRDPIEGLWQIAHFCAAVPFSSDRQTAKVKDSLRSLAISAFGLSFEGLCQVFTSVVEQYNTVCTVFSNLNPADCHPEILMEEAAEWIRTSFPEADGSPLSDLLSPGTNR